jgi:hypothetical protein
VSQAGMPFLRNIGVTMSFNFKKYEKPVEPVFHNCFATLHKKTGYITFLKRTIERFELDAEDNNYAVLHWDEEQNAMGIEVLKEDCRDAFVIKFGFKRGGGAVNFVGIHCKPFLEHYNICFYATKRLSVERDSETGFLVLSGFDLIK